MSISPTAFTEKLAYTIEEATRIGLPCRSRIYELAAAGKIRLVKDGNRTLILADEARRYIGSLPPARIGTGVPADASKRFPDGARRLG